MGSPRLFKFSQLGILLAALVLLGIFALAYRTVRSFQVASNALLQAQELRALFTDVGIQLKDLHANTRSYLTSPDERTLAARQENIAGYQRLMPRVRELVAQDPPRREAFARFERIVERLLAEHDVYLERRRTRGLAAVTARVNEGEGKKLSDELRNVSNELQASLARQIEGPLAIVRSDTTRTLQVLAAGLALTVGLVIAVVVMLQRDYRAREAAAAALQKHADEIRDLYNRAPCGYHSLDADGVFVSINDTELTWLGLKRDDVVGRMRMADVVAPVCRPAFQAALAQVKNSGSVLSLEIQVRRRDGTTFPAALIGGAIRDRQGRFVTTRATMFDLTERKRVEQITQDARTYAESIVDTVREPLVILTDDLRVNSASRVFYERFKLAPAETIGQRFAEINGGVWAIPRLLEALSKVVSAQSELKDFEVEHDIPGLGRKVMLLNARKLYRVGNGTTMMLLAIEDITERKQTEARLRELNASLHSRSSDLEAANRELEAFSYSVSHDLRAPLRHIDYFTSALQKKLPAEQLDAKTARYLDTISSSARGMGQLIDDLLSFARIGRTELHFSRVRLDELAEEVRRNLQNEASGRTVTWAIAPLPAARGDPGLLRQVFANLLSNAVKYTRQRAEARIEIAPHQAAPGEVGVVVRDNGAGFDMKYADKLFGVFQRLHSNHEFEGTGVGLANVRRIVERHGGRIWAEAAVDQGAAFYFTLPAAPGEPAPIA